MNIHTTHKYCIAENIGEFSLLLNETLYIHPLTFIIEVLSCSGSSSVANTMLPYPSLAGIHDVLC